MIFVKEHNSKWISELSLLLATGFNIDETSQQFVAPQKWFYQWKWCHGGSIKRFNILRFYYKSIVSPKWNAFANKSLNVIGLNIDEFYFNTLVMCKYYSS